MSDLDPNVLRCHAVIDGFNRSNVAVAAEHVCAGFVYWIPGRSIVAGEADGLDGLIEALARRRHESRTIDVALTAVLADDNLIARARGTAERAGRSVPVEHKERLMPKQPVVEEEVWR